MLVGYYPIRSGDDGMEWGGVRFGSNIGGILNFDKLEVVGYREA
jgi:hypothetical protein